jgi:hypothetical protein
VTVIAELGALFPVEMEAVNFILSHSVHNSIDRDNNPGNPMNTVGLSILLNERPNQNGSQEGAGFVDQIGRKNRVRFTGEAWSHIEKHGIEQLEL